MSKKPPTRKAVLLTKHELYLVAAALGLFQQQMEKAAHLTYGFTTEKQRGAMTDHGIDAIDLRNRLFKAWGE